MAPQNRVLTVTPHRPRGCSLRVALHTCRHLQGEPSLRGPGSASKTPDWDPRPRPGQGEEGAHGGTAGQVLGGPLPGAGIQVGALDRAMGWEVLAGWLSLQPIWVSTGHWTGVGTGHCLLTLLLL